MIAGKSARLSFGYPINGWDNRRMVSASADVGDESVTFVMPRGPKTNKTMTIKIGVKELAELAAHFG